MDVSLTKWLDPALDHIAREAGIPVDQFSSQVGGEGIGVGLEVISDIFTKGWLNKAIQGSAGLLALGYSIFGRRPSRLRRELLALGLHELGRITDPKPSDIAEFRASVEEFARAWRSRDWNAALSSVLRTPAEVQSMLGIRSSPIRVSTPSTPSSGSSASSASTVAKAPVTTSPAGVSASPQTTPAQVKPAVQGTYRISH